MGFRPDAAPAAPTAIGRFKPDAPAAELAPVPEPAPATVDDRVQAVGSGLSSGIAGLAGLPVDTALNVWDLGKAGAGYLTSKITGEAPDEKYFGPADRGQYLGSSESIARGMNKIGAETDTRRPDDPMSRYLHAGAAGVPGAVAGGGGAANIAKQAAVGVVSGLGAQGAADEGMDAGQQSVIANALGIAGGHAASKPLGPKPVVESTAPPEGRTTLAEIRQNGIKVTPKEASRITGDRNYFGRALQAIGGDSKISKDMAAANVPTINEMGSKAVGADSLTEKGLAPVKANANKVYSEMASLGKVAPTPELHSAIEKARGLAGKSTQRNTEIDQFVDSTLNEFGGEVDSGQVVNKVRELRRDAQNDLIGEGDKRPTVQQEALGKARRQVADALDDFLEYHAATSGKPDLAESYKENRVRLAKVGTVEGASRAGNLDAKKLFQQKEKGGKLSGQLNDVATAHEYAPESTATSAGESLMDAPGRNLDIMELPVAAMQAAARHMGVNKLLQSEFYQNLIGGPKGGPHLPEHDPNPNAFPPSMARQPSQEPSPAAPTAGPDFHGELGLAPDAPYQELPGGNLGRPQNGPNLAAEPGLQLAENAPVNAGPLGRSDARHFDPNAVDFEQVTDPQPYQPFNAGMPYSPSVNPRSEQPVVRGAVHDAGDLQLMPEPGQFDSSSLPPQGEFQPPRQGGPPPMSGPPGGSGQSAGVTVQPSTRPGYQMISVGGQHLAEIPEGAMGDLLDILNTQHTDLPAQQAKAAGQRARVPDPTGGLELAPDSGPRESLPGGISRGADMAGALELVPDGPPVQYARELGLEGDEPMGQRHGMPPPVQVTAPDSEGYISYIPGADGSRQIVSAYTSPGARGKGYGKANLLHLAEESAKAGETLNSDTSISAAQMRVYESLKKAGKLDYDFADPEAAATVSKDGGKLTGKTPVITNIRPAEPARKAG